MSLLDRFRISLARTRATIVSQFVSPSWSAEEMERALIAADFGPRLAAEIVAGTQKRLELRPTASKAEALRAAREEIEAIFKNSPLPTPHSALKVTPRSALKVFLFVGVNGTGKTTTIAKLAKQFQLEGGKVLLAAGDTFRAAAIEQLQVWGKRLGVDCVAGIQGADPGAVVHDAIRRGEGGNFSHLLVDTAGRQHTKFNLMQELAKVKRVISKALPGAPHETWLVVDAVTGSNALSQAREFHAAINLTGVIVAKLDGSAKGGVVAAIAREMGFPIRFVGLGEGAEDLAPFDPKLFAQAIL